MPCRDCSSSASRYLPALAEVSVYAARACPRPQSYDSRPLLGPHGTIEGLHLATGHGAWGISLGPGSAELVAAAILEGAGNPARAGGEPGLGDQLEPVVPAGAVDLDSVLVLAGAVSSSTSFLRGRQTTRRSLPLP